MKQALWGVFLAAMAVVVIACKSDNAAGPTLGEGQVSGTVTDRTTSTPLSGVTISATSLAGGSASTTTDANGRFSISFTIDSTTSVIVTFSKTGWRDTTIVFTIASGSITPASVVMTPRSVIGSPGGGSGLAQTIAFLGANPQEISVKGVGGLETALLSWEVRDSLGLPIDAAHAITLTFSIQNGPGGGEYISPASVSTNTNGQAFTTVTAGIRSGVLQILASGAVTLPGGGTRTVTTSPVRVVIRAGFADQAHFTVSAPRFNLPILGVANARNTVAVLVGDKYSNPVNEGTAVYFRSSAGVIQPTVFTNKDGQGSVELISGNPAPLGAYAAVAYGDGYHYIVARTLGEAGAVVTDSILVLWSGRSLISNFLPATFDIPNGGNQTFTFTVSDALGHPLAAGTAISVLAAVPPPPDPNAPVNQVQLTFGVAGGITLNDVIFPGPGATTFSCRLSDGTTNILDSIGTRVTLSVSVNGPNGQASFTTDGIVH
ncbi:MAG: carboxypeptidase regulatory-like domain-containing protein [Bacteroidota bacterium]